MQGGGPDQATPAPGGLAPAKDDNDAAASSRHRAADGIY